MVMPPFQLVEKGGVGGRQFRDSRTALKLHQQVSSCIVLPEERKGMTPNVN